MFGLSSAFTGPFRTLSVLRTRPLTSRPGGQVGVTTVRLEQKPGILVQETLLEGSIALVKCFRVPVRASISKRVLPRCHVKGIPSALNSQKARMPNPQHLTEKLFQSPSKYIQGPNAIKNAAKYLSGLGRAPLLAVDDLVFDIG